MSLIEMEELKDNITPIPEENRVGEEGLQIDTQMLAADKTTGYGDIRGRRTAC